MYVYITATASFTAAFPHFLQKPSIFFGLFHAFNTTE